MQTKLWNIIWGLADVLKHLCGWKMVKNTTSVKRPTGLRPSWHGWLWLKPGAASEAHTQVDKEWYGNPMKPCPNKKASGYMAISCYIWRFATAVRAHQIEVVTSSAVGSEVLTHKDHGRAPPGRRNPGLCQERCQAAWKGVVVSEAALHLGHGYKGKPHYI